jgi:hypothetical protein
MLGFVAVPCALALAVYCMKVVKGEGGHWAGMADADGLTKFNFKPQGRQPIPSQLCFVFLWSRNPYRHFATGKKLMNIEEKKSHYCVFM